MKTLRIQLSAFVILLGLLSSHSASACVRTHANKAVESSNMRMVAVVFATRYTDPNVQFDPYRYQTMEDFMMLMAKMDFIDSSVFFNRAEYLEFENHPPPVIGTSTREAKPPAIDPEFLKYPIGYSVAIYPDLDRPASKTPLLWTRGLHNFKEFDAPYCGFVAFMDGHVTYYSGSPDYEDPELSEIFDTDSQFAQAVRILEHVPKGWIEETPLPVRFERMTDNSLIRNWSPLFFLIAPALICGLLVGFFGSKDKAVYQKVIQGAAAFTIIFFITAMLFPCACCF